MRTKPAAILSPCDVTSVTHFAKLLVNSITLELYTVFLVLFWPEKKILLKQNLNVGILRQYILLMSSNESGGDPQSCESSSETDPVSDASVNSDGSSNSLVHVTSHCFAYDDEPIAEPGETICVPEDPDGLLPATLEQRSDGRITLEQW